MILKQERNFKIWLPRAWSFNRSLIALSDIGHLFSYEILNDPNTREVYDKYGMAGLSGPGGGGPGGGMNPEDIFAQFFQAAGGGGAGGGPFGFSFGPGAAGGPGRGRKDEVVAYEVTLEDLYNGKTVRINMEKDIACGVCKG